MKYGLVVGSAFLSVASGGLWVYMAQNEISKSEYAFIAMLTFAFLGVMSWRLPATDDQPEEVSPPSPPASIEGYTPAHTEADTIVMMVVYNMWKERTPVYGRYVQDMYSAAVKLARQKGVYSPLSDLDPAFRRLVQHGYVELRPQDPTEMAVSVTQLGIEWAEAQNQ